MRLEWSKVLMQLRISNVNDWRNGDARERATAVSNTTLTYACVSWCCVYFANLHDCMTRDCDHFQAIYCVHKTTTRCNNSLILHKIFKWFLHCPLFTQIPNFSGLFINANSVSWCTDHSRCLKRITILIHRRHEFFNAFGLCHEFLQFFFGSDLREPFVKLVLMFEVLRFVGHNRCGTASRDDDEDHTHVEGRH